MIPRLIDNQLLKWRNSPNRKPLILRGARQVGKTTLVNKFSAHYTHYIYLNLERTRDREIFERFEDINDLVPAILLDLQLASSTEDVLIFIDEIQESAAAIKQLRYFYEEYPNLHVIAAGSLLEHALSSVMRFPVGRVSYMLLQPVNFEEFLAGAQKIKLIELLDKVPLPFYSTEKFRQLFHQYAIIGGMPAITWEFIQDEEIATLSANYLDLIRAYEADIEKYASNDGQIKVISHVLRNAPKYAAERIKFERFGESNYTSKEVKEAFDALEKARLIQLIYPTSSIEPPIESSLRKSPRLQLLDTGWMNFSLTIQKDLLGVETLSDIYRGKLIEHLVIQQFQSVNPNPFNQINFWVREKKTSTAELDLIFQHNSKLIPVEIKSGATGSLRSLHQFMEKAPHPYAIRIYGGDLKVDKISTPSGKPIVLLNLPYYLVTRLIAYTDWLISEH